MKTFQTEQNIRTLVDKQLENLGWNLTAGKNCNVFQEQPRTVEERKKLKGKRPDYVLYSSDKKSGRKEPLVIIETKKPGANLDEAIKQGNEYAKTLGAPIIFATDGVYYKTLHTKKHEPLFLNGEEVDELFRELEAKKFLEDNEVNTISEEVIYDRKQLIKIFEESNDLLRDEGFRAGIERFGEFSNILFLKLIGELEDLKEEESEKTMLARHLRWSSWKNKTGQDLLSHINKIVLPEIGESYQDKDIFTPLTIKSPNILKKIIEKLDPLNLINIDSDIKGDSFEYFLKQSTATKNDLGEYFTPRHIVKVMVKLLNPQIGETIYDPFCGTGGTLIETFKHISHNMARTKINWKQLRENTLFGNEITTTARITKMNMILIGDGHSGIQQKNSLKNPMDGDEKEKGYDIVVTNMPYSQKTEYGSYYDLPGTNGDSICIQHCIKAIDKTSENGRMALVVPEGFLFRKDLQKTREYLLDRCTLKSIISLPQGVFLPYTGVKTNILYCTDVKKKKKQEKFWYFDVKNDGYSLDNHRRKLTGKTDLQKFLEYRKPENQNQKDILKIGFLEIDMKEVVDNDLVLSGNRYKQFIDYSKIPWNINKLINLISYLPKSKRKAKDGKNFGKFSFFTSSQIQKKFLNIADYNENALIIGTGGTASIHISNWFSTSADVFVVKSKDHLVLLNKYLFYLFYYKIDILNKGFRGQALKHLSKEYLNNIKIPLPPIEIQKEIVKELDGYQKVIDGARQIIENYKPQIEVDEKWKTFELGDYFKLTQIGLVRGNKDQSENYPFPYLKMDAISTKGNLSLEKSVYVNCLPNEFKQYSLADNDFLFNTRNSKELVGKCAVYKGENNKYLFNNNILRIRFNKNLSPKYLCVFLGSKQGRDMLNRIIKTTTNIAAIYQKDLTKLQIPLPNISVQNKFVEDIENEQKLIAPSQEIIKTFEKKIQKKLDFIWGK